MFYVALAKVKHYSGKGPGGRIPITLSTKPGCISMIKLLQFGIVPSLWASLGEAVLESVPSRYD